MTLKRHNIKIATILPYKENYTVEKASAASLWVSEFYSRSNFKKDNIIYGNTSSTNFLSNNYHNITLDNLKSRIKSSTNEYSKKLLIEIRKNNFDLIEIHNRPLLVFKLLKEIKINIIFYFHNDPLSMKGSKSISDRLNILKKVKKIIFVSEWSRKRFFLDIDKKLFSKTDVIYPSVDKKKSVTKKKYITFVGRLNVSKGYDLFKEAIIKILDNYPEWQALSIGDEDRRSIFINHKQHFELGFLSHKKTLRLLNQTEIAVVPSKWEEPFGRTALEATSRGCATIITNKGGLIETSDHCIVLEKINYLYLYRAIKELIDRPKKRKKIQKLSRLNVKHEISKNSKLIDKIRLSCIPSFNINYLTNKLKIINIYNQGQKHNHRLFNISVGKKFTNGFIRNGHDVLEISDRDFISNNRMLSLVPDNKKFQEYLIKTFKNYNPDFLFFGHTKNIDIETINEIKSYNNNLIISQWNEDPVMDGLSYSKRNISNIEKYSTIVDHNFITTDPNIVSNNTNLKNLHFFFIPVDKNIECFNVYDMKPNNDIFYAMSHGVNRAVLKKNTEDERVFFLDKLVKKIPKIKYDFYGFANKQPIWGEEFNNALINSKMGLNLSRGKPTKYYSSNRIASIMGNGLLTFIDERTKIDDFFNNNEIILYSNMSDLAEKILYYTKNDKIRKKIAQNGKNKYFKLFNEKKTAKYIIDRSFGN